MTKLLKSDLTRNFTIGFVIGAMVLAFQGGSAFVPEALAGVIL